MCPPPPVRRRCGAENVHGRHENRESGKTFGLVKVIRNVDIEARDGSSFCSSAKNA
jgi:hypothetical protein